MVAGWGIALVGFHLDARLAAYIVRLVNALEETAKLLHPDLFE